MGRKIALSVIAALLFTVSAVAQKSHLSGKVVGTDGNPIIGATVTFDGTYVGTQTDVDGNYTLRFPADGGGEDHSRLLPRL